jgi:predicted metal-dependent hydrolase
MESGSITFYDGSICDYKIIASKRCTMAVQVNKEGEVIVRLPYQVSAAAGHRLIVENKDWLYKQLWKIHKKQEEKQEFQWIDGASVLLFGTSVVLRVSAEPYKKSYIVRETAAGISVTGPSYEGRELECQLKVKEVMKLWYRKKAKGYLEKKTAQWAMLMKVTFERISIRDQATRWGSCSGKGNINFNWRLVLIPEALADYVVVHELAHRLHMNHSRQFWSVVAQMLPDYLERRKELKYWGEKLDGIY